MSRIEHFAVYAENPAALKDFYVTALGLHVIVENPGPPPAYFLADDRGMAVEVLARPEGQANANQRWVCHFAFWVDDYQRHPPRPGASRDCLRGGHAGRKRRHKDRLLQRPRRQSLPDRLAPPAARHVIGERQRAQPYVRQAFSLTLRATMGFHHARRVRFRRAWRNSSREKQLPTAFNRQDQRERATSHDKGGRANRVRFPRRRFSRIERLDGRG